MLEHALLDRHGWERLRAGWVRVDEDGRPFRAWELDARREVLRLGLRPDLERVGRAAAAALDVPADDDLLAAVETLSVHLERYRTYLPDEEGRPALRGRASSRPSRTGPSRRADRAAGRRARASPASGATAGSS